MMDSSTMGHVITKYFSFPCQFSLQLLHIHDLSAFGISSFSVDSIAKEQVILFFAAVEIYCF
jgi:hypothetical protein